MHILSNGLYLVSLQKALKVTRTQNLGAITKYFATGIMKDPVFIFMLDLKLYTNILMYLKVQTVFMSKTAKSAPKFNIKFHVVRAASLC